ncbi:MAG: efflux RND transporter periplasmic adaptor subunit [Candidatus Brocadiaceae bacterium]|nr:efflux RND transporter periplasmic adaptor subunit [Candidatus Brocadiaceae bacterium]
MPNKKAKTMKMIVIVISGILIFLAGGITAIFFSPGDSQRETTEQINVSGDNSTEIPHVVVQNPVRQTIYDKVLLPGDILPWGQATLFAKVSGYLEEILYDKGDWVQKGDVIARIALPELENELKIQEAELAQCKADIERAQSEVTLREIIYNRLAKVQAESKDLVPEEHVDEAKGQLEVAKAELALVKSRGDVVLTRIEKTKTLLGYTTIKAPFSGVITNRWVDPGALIQAATTSQDKAASIVHIMDMNTLRVQVHVPEPDTPFIETGKKATLTVNELPGKIFDASVSRYSWALERNTRTMLVEIDVSNAEHILRPGMFAKATIHLKAHEDVLTIPAESLITESDKAYIYVADDNNTVRKVPVKTGIDDGIIVEILDGLQESDKVIVAGKHLVTEGDTVITSESNVM